MKTVLAAMCMMVALAGPASGEQVTQTYPASIDRVWATTMAVLKHQGWDIEQADRTIGWISTDSRRVEGEDYGVYAKGVRHKLVLHVKEAGANRTTVSIERSLFKRERILWVDKDEPVTTTDRSVERGLLATIERSL